MLDKNLDLTDIKKHQAHHQIIYSQVQKSPKSIYLEMPFKKRDHTSLSLEFSSKDPKFPKTLDRPIAIPLRKLTKSPE